MSEKKRVIIPDRPVWESRWTQPTIEQLFEPLKEQYQKSLPALMERIMSFSGVSQKLLWHGFAWKWTIQYDLTITPKKGRKKVKEPWAYMVPNLEKPVFCMPLKQEMVDNLPLNDFHKYVREGVNDGKYGVNIRWCTWSPSAQTEVEYLTELLTHVHEMATGSK